MNYQEKMEDLRQAHLPFLEEMLIKSKDMPTFEKFNRIKESIVKGTLPENRIEFLNKTLETLKLKSKFVPAPLHIVKQECVEHETANMKEEKMVEKLLVQTSDEGEEESELTSSTSKRKRITSASVSDGDRLNKLRKLSCAQKTLEAQNINQGKICFVETPLQQIELLPKNIKETCRSNEIVENTALTESNQAILSNQHLETPRTEPRARKSYSIYESSTSVVVKEGKNRPAHANVSLNKKIRRKSVCTSISEKLSLSSSKDVHGSEDLPTKISSTVQKLVSSPVQSFAIDEQTKHPTENRASPLKIKNSVRKPKRYKTEADKLKDDIMASFIGEEVLSANGLRQRKPKLLKEMMQDYDSDNSSSTENEPENESLRSFQELGEVTSESEEENSLPVQIEIKECSISLNNIDHLLTEPVGNSYLFPKAADLINSANPKKPATTIDNDNVATDLTEILNSRLQITATSQTGSIETDSNRKQANQTTANLRSDVNSETVASKFASVEDDIITIIEDSDEENSSDKQVRFNLTATNHIKYDFPISPTSELVSSAETAVYYLSFAQSRGGTNLKCNSEKCKYQTFSEQLFQYHIQTKHLLLKWSGWCCTCNKSVSDFGSLLDEYNHMHNYHINVESDPSETKSRNTNESSDDNSKKLKLKIVEKRKTSKKVPKLTSTESKKKLFDVEADKKRSTLVAPRPVMIHTQQIPSESRMAAAALITINSTNSHVEQKSLTTTAAVLSPILKPTSLEIQDTPSSSMAFVNHPPAIVTLYRTDVSLPISTTSTTLVHKCVPLSASIVSTTSAPIKAAPMLKFRKLPGDKLSTTTNNSSSTSYSVGLQSIENSTKFQEKASQSFATDNLNETVRNPTPGKIKDSGDTITKQASGEPEESVGQIHFRNGSDNRHQGEIFSDMVEHVATTAKSSGDLRPWINRNDDKTQQDIREMLQRQCLLAKYKCMGSNCHYYTSDMMDFRTHLEMHENDLHQDIKFFGRCSYCKASFNDIIKLTHHVRSDHRNDRYNCSKCFYRAVTKVQVRFHLEKYHKDSHEILVFNSIVPVGVFRDMLQLAKKNRSLFVSPMTCPTCKERFYCYEEYFIHMSSQHATTQARQRCNKCSQETSIENLKDHLLDCHKIMPFQCLLCRFGAKSMYELKVHFVDEHSNKYPFYCCRQKEHGNSFSNSSPEVMDVKHWTQLKVLNPKTS